MPRDREYLLDILESARLACGYLRDKTEQEFLDDVQQVGRVERSETRRSGSVGSTDWRWGIEASKATLKEPITRGVSHEEQEANGNIATGSFFGGGCLVRNCL
jgi:hypothetical protein